MVSRRTKLLLLLGLILVVAVWLFRSQRRSAQQPEKAAEPIARAAPESSTARADKPDAPAPPQSPSKPAEQLPIPPCWDGLLDLDEHASLDSLREAMLAGLHDPLLLEYLEARLAEVIGTDAQAALGVLESAKDAGPPLSTHLLAALQKSAAAQK